MSILAPFQPKPGSTVNGASGASQDLVLDPASKQFLVTNVGTAVVFVRLKFTGDTTAATNADAPVLPNSAAVMSKKGDPGTGHSLLAMFGAGGSTVYVTSGEGW